MEMPSIAWVEQDIIPEGLTILAGKPKIGKSWLILDLALRVAADGDSAIYLALEDNPRRMQRRLMAISDKRASTSLHLEFQHARLGDGGEERLKELLDANPGTRLLIIDTLARVRRRAGNLRNMYQIDYEALEPLHELAGSYPGLAIVVVHHLRKSESDDPVDLVSGTNGLTACADTLLVLRRSRGDAERFATLFITGRDVEERTLTLSREGGRITWEIVGDEAMSDMSSQRRSIYDYLAAASAPSEPATIAAATGLSPESVRHLLGNMVIAGLLRRVGYGRYAIAAPTE
jgi:hypothetical protein